MSPRPNLFLIGAAKAGTTSLYEYIAGHPEIYMSRVKEPQYFSPDLPDPLHRFPYGEGLDRYLALFAGASTEKWRGEASTYYIFSHDAPRLIHEFDPASRIVAVLRNPVDAIYSLHGHLIAYGHESIAEFEQALAAELDEASVDDARRLKIQRHGTYLDRGRYAEQLAPWLELFGREQCRIIIFDDLAADPAVQLKGLLRFLDVDENYQPASLEAHNKSHRVRGRVVNATRSAPARWLRHSVLTRVVGADGASRLGRTFKRSRFVRAEVQRPPLAAATRIRLEQEFAQDVERLSDMLGRDLVTEWFGEKSGGSEMTGSRILGQQT